MSIMAYTRRVGGVRIWVTSWILVLLLTVTAGAERIYLDITAADVRKVALAVPPFVDAAGVVSEDGKKMASLLGRGLEFHGFIRVIEPSQYGGSQEADWQSLGVDYVVLGSYQKKGGNLQLEMRILDVAENKMLFGRRYRGAMSRKDDMVLRFCDAVIEEFTGEPGISRSRVAFISDATGRKEVYVGDVLGRHIRQITRHKHLTVSPRFSPDGKFLAYSSYHSGNQNLYITDLRQSKITRAISRRRGMNLAPAWSPDGKTMAVTLSKDGSPDLYLIDRQGRILERLTKKTGINVSPTWSPDGSKLAFVSDRSGKPQIYIMDMRSRRVQRLTFEGSENSEPNWSPKGDLIAYTGLVGGTYHIFTIDPSGKTTPKQITSGNGEFESPSWSPDGKQIVLSRRRGGKQELCVVFKNGKGLRTLFHLKGNQSYPQWAAPEEE